MLGSSAGDWTPGRSGVDVAGLSSEGLFARDLEAAYETETLADLEDLLSGLAEMVDDRFGHGPTLDGKRLLSWAERHPYPPALVLARGLALLGPASLRHRAAKVATKLEGTLRDTATRADLDRIESLGEGVPHRAFLVIDRLETALRLFLDCRRPPTGPEAGRSIGMFLEAEFALGLMATGYSFDTDVDLAVEALADDERFVVTEVSLAEAGAIAARSRAVFDAAALDPDDELDLIALESKAIVDHYFSRCPEGALPAPVRPATEAETNAVVEEFMASPAAAMAGASIDDVDLLLSTVADLMGDPLRLNPTSIEVIAPMLVPFGSLAAAGNGHGTTAALAAVAMALVEFAGEKRGLPHPAREVNRLAAERFITPLRRPTTGLVLPGTVGRSAGDTDPLADAPSDWADPWHDVGVDGPIDLDAAWARHEASLVDFLRRVCADEVGKQPPAELSHDAREAALAEVAWPFEAEPDLDAIAEELGVDDWDVQTLEDIGGTEALAARFSDALADDPVARMSAVDPVDWMRVVWRVLSADSGSVFDAGSLARLVAEPDPGAHGLDDPGGLDDPDEIEYWLQALSPAFDHWRAIGVFDDRGHLTEVGRWLLPRSFCRSLAHDFDR